MKIKVCVCSISKIHAIRLKLGEWKAGGRGLRRGAAAVEGKTILIAGDSPDEGVSLLNIAGEKPELTSSLDVPQYWVRHLREDP